MTCPYPTQYKYQYVQCLPGPIKIPQTRKETSTKPIKTMTDNLAVKQAANLPRRGRASSGERDDRLLVRPLLPHLHISYFLPPSLTKNSQRRAADTRTTINTTNTRNRRKSRRSPTPNRTAGFGAGSGARRRSRSRSKAPSKSRSRERRISE